MENEEVKYYQPKFARWIKSNKWDDIAEKLTATQIDIVSRVMKVEKDGDLSWNTWLQCDHILERIRKISNELN